MFPLFETIRLKDGEPQLLYLHQARMERSSWELFNRPSKLILAEEINTPEEFGAGIIKLRLDYNEQTTMQNYTRYKKRDVKTLKVVNADDITYAIKKSDRSHLNRLWSTRGGCDDILIIKNGMVTDTSYTNILFLDGDNWITPDTPLLKGTQRTYLIANNKISERPVSLKDLKMFQGFQLINSMMPFDPKQVESLEGVQL